MYEKDYFKRLIRSICKMTVALTLGKDSVKSDIENENFDMKLTEDDLLEIMVKKYLAEGDINKAEDILFKAMYNRKTERIYEIALNFYKEIEGFSDDKLQACNFSRQEIRGGLKDLKRIYIQ